MPIRDIQSRIKKIDLPIRTSGVWIRSRVRGVQEVQVLAALYGRHPASRIQLGARIGVSIDLRDLRRSRGVGIHVVRLAASNDEDAILANWRISVVGDAARQALDLRSIRELVDAVDRRPSAKAHPSAERIRRQDVQHVNAIPIRHTRVRAIRDPSTVWEFAGKVWHQAVLNAITK